MLPPAVTTTVQIGPTVVSATDKPSVSDKIDPSHSDRAAYLSAFKAYCKRFYSNSPPAADRSSLCHFFTLFDASQHSLPAASGGGSTPSHIQLPLHLLPPNLSTNDHDAIRHILQSTGFTADGHMHYSQDLSLYHQTKNRQRRVFHVAVQTAQQQELTHLMATTSFNDLLTKEDRHRDIKNYCALVAAEVGMYPFVLGLSRFLQSQGQNPAAIVQWVLDDATLLQGPQISSDPPCIYFSVFLDAQCRLPRKRE
ncbi:hypothetical protein BSLG_006797 [Batrachochytrium salamandrivorans]|nr:hypothetical protein BSLG_006797 [Batrachochytrium salamandrivorans]